MIGHGHRGDAPKLSERDIERTCSEFLALDGWRCLKTDPVSRREWGKGFGEKGMADCLYNRYKENATKIPDLYRPWAEVLWIEWKRAHRFSKRENCWVSTKASEAQMKWHAAERARGALTLIAGIDFPATIDGFVAFYRASGLCRRVGAKEERG